MKPLVKSVGRKLLSRARGQVRYEWTLKHKANTCMELRAFCRGPKVNAISIAAWKSVNVSYFRALTLIPLSVQCLTAGPGSQHFQEEVTANQDPTTAQEEQLILTITAPMKHSISNWRAWWGKLQLMGLLLSSMIFWEVGRFLSVVSHWHKYSHCVPRKWPKWTLCLQQYGITQATLFDLSHPWLNGDSSVLTVCFFLSPLWFLPFRTATSHWTSQSFTLVSDGPLIILLAPW